MLVFTAIAFAVTLIFRARRRRAGRRLRHRRAGADDLGRGRRDARRRGARGSAAPRSASASIALVFVYTTVVNVVERAGRPEDRRASSSPRSSSSRWSRGSCARPSCASTEVELDETARRFIAARRAGGEIRIIANHPDERNAREYLLKEREQRAAQPHPAGRPGAVPGGRPCATPPSSRRRCAVRGEEIGGYRVLRAEGASVPNAIAALLLYLRDTTGKRAARLLRLDRGQPAQVPGALRPVRRRRHRAGHPRGAAPGRAESRDGARPSTWGEGRSAWDSCATLSRESRHEDDSNRIARRLELMRRAAGREPVPLLRGITAAILRMNSHGNRTAHDSRTSAPHSCVTVRAMRIHSQADSVC